MDLENIVTHKTAEGKDTHAKIPIDYKDVKHLRRFVTERGKILPSRMTRFNRQQQKVLERAIKHARELALLPYTIHDFTIDFKGRDSH